MAKAILPESQYLAGVRIPCYSSGKSNIQIGSFNPKRSEQDSDLKAG